MRVKIHGPEKEWGPIRQAAFWFAICILIAIAAFEGGYIMGYLDRDELKTEIRKLNSRVLDHSGKIESLETMGRKDKTGSGMPAGKK